MIRLKGVSFRYENAGEGVYNLKDIDLNVEKGECVVLCGKSGCGKTTVTRLINGLIPHYYEGQLKGSVFVDKTEIADRSCRLWQDCRPKDILPHMPYFL